MGCLSKKMAFLGLVLIMLHMTPCCYSSRKLTGMVQHPFTAIFIMPAKMNSFAAVQKSTTKTSKPHFLKGLIEKWSTKHHRRFLHDVPAGPNPIGNSFPLARRKPVPQSP